MKKKGMVIKIIPRKQLFQMLLNLELHNLILCLNLSIIYLSIIIPPPLPPPLMNGYLN